MEINFFLDYIKALDSLRGRDIIYSEIIKTPKMGYYTLEGSGSGKVINFHTDIRDNFMKKIYEPDFENIFMGLY
ncbi:MAG: hypothetical protein HGA35_02290 [Erysipelotrichaceae bacterium]|nr:hypothetical protein [Erysipelotrichaceae bacterium]